MKRRGRSTLRATAVVVATLAAAGCTPLTAFDALIPKDGGVVRAAKDAAYGSNPRQKLDLYRPSARASKPLPIIVFFYGGSWNSGTKAGYEFVGRALASRGFLVAIPDYRLVPEVRYPAFIEDGAAAVRWVSSNAAKFGGDPNRIVIAGHSAGAYNGAMLAYDARWLGADRRRIVGFVGLAGPYDFSPFSGAIARAAFAGTADAPGTQPINHVMVDAAPAFLGTGSQDRTVLPRNSDSLATRLLGVGAMVVRKRYQAVGHVGILTALAQPFRRRAPVLEDMVSFVRDVTREQPLRANHSRSIRS